MYPQAKPWYKALDKLVPILYHMDTKIIGSLGWAIFGLCAASTAPSAARRIRVFFFSGSIGSLDGDIRCD